MSIVCDICYAGVNVSMSIDSFVFVWLQYYRCQKEHRETLVEWMSFQFECQK